MMTPSTLSPLPLLLLLSDPLLGPSAIDNNPPYQHPITHPLSLPHPINTSIPPAHTLSHPYSHHGVVLIVGMGDPLLGPSAIDAIAMGCMFINPLYTKPGTKPTL